MNTSGDGIPNVILYIVVLALFAQVALRLLRGSTAPRRFPVVALIITVVIGVPSLLQFAVPAITASLARNPELTLHQGQWWRVFTAMLAQDGGLVAAIFNLLVVAGVALLGEWIWGRWRTVVLFLLPSIILNLLAIVFWDASGGGSSFASDGLLMSMCGLALVILRDVLAKVLAVIAILIGLALVVFLNDAHGVALLLGAAFGILFALPRLRGRAALARSR
ncbi:MAG TPA: rhomboid family intramembrane serine protease [Galbitalea sp.]|nr:rhomboid family intramembrane serine protease [Galbitalea sp.]